MLRLVQEPRTRVRLGSEANLFRHSNRMPDFGVKQTCGKHELRLPGEYAAGNQWQRKLMVDKHYISAQSLPDVSFSLGTIVYDSGFRPDFILALWLGANWNRCPGIPVLSKC